MRISLTLGLLLALAGGCGQASPGPKNPTPLVAVREEVSRSPTFALPLDEAARGRMLMFLAAGGNNDGIEDGALVTVVYPDAEQRWSRLLTLLSDPANVKVVDLTGPTYSSWFRSPPVRHVVDARDARPNVACPPFAITQERFVWVFKSSDCKRLESAFVQQAVAERAE